MSGTLIGCLRRAKMFEHELNWTPSIKKYSGIKLVDSNFPSFLSKISFLMMWTILTGLGVVGWVGLGWVRGNHHLELDVSS